MAGMDKSAAGMTTGKMPWQRPRLQELGNLRSFVQAGSPVAKSGNFPDSCNDPAAEQMGTPVC